MRGYRCNTRNSPAHTSNDLGTGQQCIIRPEHAEVTNRYPLRIEHLCDRADFKSLRYESETEVEMQVFGFSSALWDLVSVDPDEGFINSSKRTNACLLENLSTSCRLNRGITDLDVTSRLEPPAELAVMDEEQRPAVG